FYRGLPWSTVQAAIRRAGPSVVLLMLAPLVGNFVHMLGWRALLPAEVRPSPWRAFRIFVAAQAGNEIGLGVLGESVKITTLPGEQRAVATKAVVLDNLSSLVALVAVIGSVTAFVWHGALSLLVLLGVGAALGGWLAARKRRSGSERLRSLVIAFVAHYFGKLWIVAEFALALALLAAASARSSALLALTSTIASCVGALVPGQLGILEAALAGSAAAAKLSASTVLTVSLLRRLRSVLWVALGAVFFSELCSKVSLGRNHASIAVAH
ncbi:MAG TPA: lysylphosphatidylglycerol synthase domain-containing protein, partial [Polyangiaceae bacterium]